MKTISILASVATFSVLLLLAPVATNAAPVEADGVCKLFPVSADEACGPGLVCEQTPTSLAGEGACCAPGSDNCRFGLGEQSTFQALGLGKEDDLKKTLATIINIALGFLGIIAVIIVMYGGFKWMTAAGNEEQVGEARKLIVGGVIGLLVIFMAWAIASFVVSNLQSATVAT